ncbi:synaptojanin-2-binding protein [Protopterus annectens]|uniref:synaptojanin-2-binding protein n=1 Tax=Protopterus annectens TaxID=7888 RepID=UPI001CFC2F82|nr:synaptojanin-2-binding protein [Protopterus annectens]
MNGNLKNTMSHIEIQLSRGPSGLGFNVVGGTDQQYISNDSGIFVTKIREDGAAAMDGRLEEGDKILSINGIELNNMTHQEAVNLFRTAGEHVTLQVLKREQNHMNGPSGYKGSGDGSSSKTFLFVVMAAVAAVAVLGFMRYRHRI